MNLYSSKLILIATTISYGSFFFNPNGMMVLGRHDLMWSSLLSTYSLIMIGIVYCAHVIISYLVKMIDFILGRTLNFIYSKTFRSIFIVFAFGLSFILPTSFLSVFFVLHSIITAAAGVSTRHKRVFLQLR
jgi:hypothetical protein